jgi:hypothetical protein
LERVSVERIGYSEVSDRLTDREFTRIAVEFGKREFEKKELGK